MSSTKRRLAFAAPFVITSLLAPACSHPSPKQPIPAGAPDASPADAAVIGEEPVEPAPEAPGKWVRVDDRWVFVYTDRSIGTVRLYPNGTCDLHADAMCGDPTAIEVTYCNPPPPQPVQCPAGAPDPAADE